MINIFGIFGGIFLILGAYLLYRGYAFYSIIAYFFADLCWLMISILNHAIFGAISILIGIIFSIGVWIKMNKGIFTKTLFKSKTDSWDIISQESIIDLKNKKIRRKEC